MQPRHGVGGGGAHGLAVENSIAVMPPSACATSRMPGIKQAGAVARASRRQGGTARRPRPGRTRCWYRAGRRRLAPRSAPASVSNCAARSTAAMPSGSTGASKPGSSSTPTVKPDTPSSIPSSQSRGSSGRQNGSRRSQRAMALNISAASRTVRVIGPAHGDAGKGTGRPLRDPAIGRFQPDEAAPGGGNADRTSRVRADVQRTEPGGTGGARAGG